MELRKERKIYFLLSTLVILICSQLVSAAQAPTRLTIGNVVGAPGGQVVVPIKISSSPGLDSFNMVILYDPEVLQPDAGGISYVDRMGTLTANYDLFMVNAAIPGEIHIGGATLTPTTREAILMKLLFTINPGASGSSIVNMSLVDDPGNDLRNFRVIPGSVAVSIPPAITGTTPGDSESNIPLNAQITATFNKDMNPITINRGTFTIKDPKNVAITGTITYNNKTATFTPSRALNPDTIYTATLTTKITDLIRNALSTNYVWQFITEPPDLRTPEILTTTPGDSESNIPLNAQITATFNKDMNPITINRGTFTIKDPKNASITGTITYNNRTVTYKPFKQLKGNTTYTATLTTKITDLNKQALPNSSVWQFTTL